MKASDEQALLAAGCFWGVQHLLKTLPGVHSVTSGYTGGKLKNPTYRDICTGESGHVEAVLVDFNPEILEYKDLLVHFFKLHDPTQTNGQGVDIGPQYLSVVYVFSEKQQDTALKLIQELNQSGIFKAPIATQVLASQTFWPAEDYHQDYFEKNGGYVCHYFRDWSL